MKLFNHSEPYLYKDKDNRKWAVRYSITYQGQPTKYIKEYGRLYFDKNLNQITDIRQREKEFNKLLRVIETDLENGIDIKNRSTLTHLYIQNQPDIKLDSFDKCYEMFLMIKGYVNPIAKKVLSTRTIKSLLANQFKPFLVQRNLDHDIKLITKSHILEFLNFYYFHSDQKIKWNNTTFNNKKGILGVFFETLVHEEKIETNPVAKIRSKAALTTKRYGVFTKKEKELIFEWLDKYNPFMATISRVIYYSYIRESELGRLKVADFLIKERKIRIEADNAKGQNDKLTQFVMMPKPLQEALSNYVRGYERNLDYYMFSDSKRPGQHEVKNHWHQKGFHTCLKELRKLHPNLFQAQNLSLYSMKHSGVTHFVNDNASKESSTNIFRYVQRQCRHSDIRTTEIYLRKLELNILIQDQYDFD